LIKEWELLKNKDLQAEKRSSPDQVKNSNTV